MKSMMLRNTSASLLTLLVLLFLPATVTLAEVVLWNKLGSEYEVTHSEIGPNGTIVG